MRRELRPRRPAPAAPPDDPPPRIGKALVIGACGLALPMLLYTILMPVLGEGTTPLFAVFLLSLLPATAAAFICAGSGILRIGYAMCILIGAPFLSLALQEARIFGPVPSLEAADAPAHPAAAGFVLPDDAPRADLAREVQARISTPRRDMRGRSSGSMTLRGRFTVVPVVDPDWTPARRVAVVAVLDHGPDGEARAVPGAPWDAGRGVLQLLPEPLRDHAVRQALAEAGWKAVPEMVVGRWVADPRWARLEAAKPLLLLYALALLGLAMVILSRHPRVASRLDLAAEAPPPGQSLPLGRGILQGIAALTLPCLLALGLRHAGVDPGIMVLGICFAVVPSLMIALGGLGSRTPIGVVICGVILVVFIPLAVAARGVAPDGALPMLAGARLADLQEAMMVLGAGWLAWGVLVLAGRLLEERRGTGA